MSVKKFAIFDIETTGFDILKHEIIEIGLVLAEKKEKKFEIIEEVEIKIKPTNIELADPVALRINGYNEMEWMFAYSKNQGLQLFANKVEGAILVGHNLSFDWSFISKLSAELNIEIKSHFHKLDTLSIAFARFKDDPDINKFSLKALCDFYDIKNERAHTALSDSRATLLVLEKLLG